MRAFLNFLLLAFLRQVQGYAAGDGKSLTLKFIYVTKKN